MWCKFANPRFSFSISFFFFRRVLLELRMRWDHMCNPRWAASFNKINFELCCAPDHFLYVYIIENLLLRGIYHSFHEDNYFSPLWYLPIINPTLHIHCPAPPLYKLTILHTHCTYTYCQIELKKKM